jgi:hypothetical protein
MRLARFGTPAVLLSLLASPAVEAAPEARPEWQSGFETGFPGEFLDFDDGAYSADGTVNAGRAEVWTIVGSEDPVSYAGEHVYKGWPTGVAADVHRAYPVLHVDIPSPVVSSLMVYLDVDFSSVSETDWVHIATFGNNPDWAVFTMSVRAGKLEMAHLDWSYVGPPPQPDFPLRTWVRLTTYMDFQGSQAITHVWQDGVHIFEGPYTEVSGTNLMRAHWGWYSSGAVSAGAEYNDEIQIWSLSERLTDFDMEPASPYGGSGGTSGGGSGGTSGAANGGGGTGGGGTGGGGGAAPTTGGSGTGAMGGTGNPTGGNTTGGNPIGGNTTGGSDDGGAPAASDGGNSDDGGCGCRVGRSGGHRFSAFVLVGLGIFLRRMRRRARSF